jgi:hypothetical protein
VGSVLLLIFYSACPVPPHPCRRPIRLQGGTGGAPFFQRSSSGGVAAVLMAKLQGGWTRRLSYGKAATEGRGGRRCRAGMMVRWFVSDLFSHQSL